jgi:hypothetical protein
MRLAYFKYSNKIRLKSLHVKAFSFVFFEAKNYKNFVNVAILLQCYTAYEDIDIDLQHILQWLSYTLQLTLHIHSCNGKTTLTAYKF